MTQARQAAPPGLEEYNPFTDAQTVGSSSHLSSSNILYFNAFLMCMMRVDVCSQTPRAAAPAVSTQPAIMKPTEEPPAYSQPQTKVAASTPAPNAAAVGLYWGVDSCLNACRSSRREPPSC